jgi:CRISPR-associated endonuclease Csy4
VTRVDAMSHYLDIHLRPDPEFPTHQLLSALYAKLHRALVRLESQQIGVSFPGHTESPPNLGSHLRLQGPLAALESLMQTQWLTGMRDHIHLSAIQGIPAEATHRRVVRVQADSNPDRLRRRAMRRHGIDMEAARERIPDSSAKKLRLPFIQMGSQSTKQASFPIFIRHLPLEAKAQLGNFNSYGLSSGATIAWF